MVIMVFAAHPDDEVIGAGGTIAKYAREGRQVVSVIFSYGEGSDPASEPENIIQKRVNESKKSAKILGIKETIFLGLSDMKFSKDVAQPSTKKKLSDILQRYKPKMIFTHSADDLHPAHKGVGRVVKEVLDELKLNPKIYAFTVSVPIKFKKRDMPRIYIDVSETFQLKINALKAFKSQKELLSFYFIPLQYFRAWFDGFKARCKYAEVFYKW